MDRISEYAKRQDALVIVGGQAATHLANQLLSKNKNVDIINYSYFNNRFLSKSIIGCALAHIKCWKRHILNRNNYYVKKYKI